MITIKKLNKKYGKRKIQVFENNKKLGEITECWHWICIPKENHEILRKIAIENLWWLLHSDHIGEGYTELEAWEEKIKRWDKGRMYGVNELVPEDSLFFPGEKEIALNSINNK